MPLYRINGDSLELIEPTPFSVQGIQERRDLQRLLRDSPDAVEPGLTIVAEEFGHWEESSRRIDLLALDREGRLVVIELKRTDDGGHMELQALRYAAMTANMTLEQLVDAHDEYLRRRGIAGEARARVLAALGAQSEEDAVVDSARPRIFLVSGDFSKEITTSVLWLNGFGIDIRCIRAKLHKMDDQLLVDVEQILPLPEASEYLVRMRQKADETEVLNQSRRERTLHVLLASGDLKPGTRLAFDERRYPVEARIDRRRLRAVIADDPTVRNNVIWEFDGARYSLSALTQKLRAEGLGSLPGGPLNGYYHWCIESNREISLWELAEQRRKQQGSQTNGSSAITST